jgi:Fe-S cluster assembly protein SufD
MTTTNIDKLDLIEKLRADFQAFEKQLNGKSQSTLHQIRRQAFQNFEKLGIPTTKHEEWKYTNVGRIFKQEYNFKPPSNIQATDIESIKIPNLEANVLVLLNGKWQAKYSSIKSKNLVIKPLQEAIETEKDLLEKYFAKFTNNQDETFTALNTAFAQDGLFIYVADNQVVDLPLILYYINDAHTENVALQPRNLFIFGKSAEATLIEKYDTLGTNSSFTNLVNEVFVHQNAKVKHYRIQNESESAYHVATTQVYQERDSLYDNNTVSLNGALIRNNLNIRLDGQNIESHMIGLYMLTGKTLVDNHTIADHQQPNSMSNELYKGIIDGNASGVFNGKIFVRKDAQKTNAYQQNRNVLLSDSASVNTKPQLEIWADDVKCSHGATTGALDESAMFYLRARGIPPKEARALLVHAFAYEIIEKIEIEAIRTYLDEIVMKRLV